MADKFPPVPDKDKFADDLGYWTEVKKPRRTHNKQNVKPKESSIPNLLGRV
jgi:hypothetical protein